MAELNEEVKTQALRRQFLQAQRAEERTGEFSSERYVSLLRSFHNQTLGIGTFDVVGTDPNVLAFYTEMIKLATGELPSGIEVSMLKDSGEVSPPPGHKITPGAVFFLGLCTGVFLSELGLASLIERKD